MSPLSDLIVRFAKFSKLMQLRRDPGLSEARRKRIDDVAKLLPCPTCKSETPDWRNLVYSDEGRPQFCRDPYHPRPQSAPPAGEPDFHRWLDQKIAEWSAAGGFHDFAVAAKVIRDRLGLAARPKVEDGEVVGACQSLRSAARDSMQRKEYDVKPGNHWLEKIADLLERLAGELAESDAAHAVDDPTIPTAKALEWREEARKRHAVRRREQKKFA